MGENKLKKLVYQLYKNILFIEINKYTTFSNQLHVN